MNIKAKYIDKDHVNYEVTVERFYNVPDFLSDEISKAIDLLACNEIISKWKSADASKMTTDKYTLESAKYHKALNVKDELYDGKLHIGIDTLTKLISTGTKNYNINKAGTEIKKIWSLAITYYNNYNGTFDWSDERKKSAKEIKVAIDEYMNTIISNSEYFKKDSTYKFKTNNKRFEDLMNSAVAMKSSNGGGKITTIDAITFQRKFSIWACVMMGIEMPEKEKKEKEIKTF